MAQFRVVQGAGAALMFPAALAIVVAAFPLAERGKALALFFGITGASPPSAVSPAATSPSGPVETSPPPPKPPPIPPPKPSGRTS